MKATCILLCLLFAAFSTSFAQPQLSIGATGGLQIVPERNELPVIVGLSSWYHAGKAGYLSGEFVSYKGCDRYPGAPAGLLRLPLRDDSQTLRLALGFHFPLFFENSSVVNLLGINFGHSWDHARSRLLGPAPEASLVAVGEAEDHLQRSVLYATWTALSLKRRMPFYLQARYGFSFSGVSWLALDESKLFGQAVAGVHWSIF